MFRLLFHSYFGACLFAFMLFALCSASTARAPGMHDVQFEIFTRAAMKIARKWRRKIAIKIFSKCFSFNWKSFFCDCFHFSFSAIPHVSFIVALNYIKQIKRKLFLLLSGLASSRLPLHPPRPHKLCNFLSTAKSSQRKLYLLTMSSFSYSNLKKMKLCKFMLLSSLWEIKKKSC